MGNIGVWQIVLILAIVLILFGAGKLPRVMGDVAISQTPLLYAARRGFYSGSAEKEKISSSGSMYRPSKGLRRVLQGR